MSRTKEAPRRSKPVCGQIFNQAFGFRLKEMYRSHLFGIVVSNAGKMSPSSQPSNVIWLEIQHMHNCDSEAHTYLAEAATCPDMDHAPGTVRRLQQVLVKPTGSTERSRICDASFNHAR